MQARISGDVIARDTEHGVFILYECPNCGKVKWDRNPENQFRMFCDCPMPPGGDVPRLEPITIDC